MAKSIKKAKPKNFDKYDITVKLTGNPDQGLKKLLVSKKSTKKINISFPKTPSMKFIILCLVIALFITSCHTEKN